MVKIWKVEFEGVYPVGNCLIICAPTLKEANKIALKTCYTDKFKIKEVDISKPCVIEYLSGDY